MNTCEYQGDVAGLLRSHPWLDSRLDPESHYYDLKLHPARIRSSLEDFLPWSHFPAVEQFYGLLEWLNGPGLALESNDCAFSPPHANPNRQVRKPLECSGRVMLLFRDLQRNQAPAQLSELTLRLHVALAPLDPALRFGLIGTTLVPVRYRTLAVAPEAQLGSQLMVSFWSWGASPKETMGHLNRLMTNLSQALRAVLAAESSPGRSEFEDEVGL